MVTVVPGQVGLELESSLDQAGRVLIWIVEIVVLICQTWEVEKLVERTA